MKRFILMLAALTFCKMAVYALPSPLPTATPPSLVISSQPALANAVATVTITTPTSVGPYSAGNYTYVSKIYVVAFATATIAGTTAPVSCTTVGITNTPKLFVPTVLTVGAQTVLDLNFYAPLQSVIGSNVVISCPAQSGVLYNMFVTYYQGS